MNVNVSKVWNESNEKKRLFSCILKTVLPLLLKKIGIDLQNNETYELQCTRCKMMITTTILSDRTNMYCSINM